MWADGAGLNDSALIEVSARDGTDVLAVFHRLIGQANSSAVRRLEPLLRRRLSGNSARLSAARARLRDKSGGRDRDAAGGTQPTLLQVADTGNRLSSHSIPMKLSARFSCSILTSAVPGNSPAFWTIFSCRRLLSDSISSALPTCHFCLALF